MRTLRIPRKYENARVSAIHDDQLRKWMYTFLGECDSSGKAAGVTFYGPNGTGKTYAAAALARFLYGISMVEHPPVFARAAEVVDLWNEHDSYREQTYRSTFRTCDLLVLDDLGKEDRTTEYRTSKASAIIGNVLRSRVQAALPTIITSNVPYEEFEETYGKSITSLLHESSSSFCLVNGPDKRMF